MLLTDFVSIKNDLNFCPIDGWRLDTHETNTAIRTCVNHGNIFIITQTARGYTVQVDLGNDSTHPSCALCKRTNVNVVLKRDEWVCTGWDADPLNSNRCSSIVVAKEA